MKTRTTSSTLTKTIDPVRHSFNRSPWRRGFLLIPCALVLASLALSPTARAICKDGCDGSENTFLGQDALFSLTSGSDNTAIGFNALYYNTTGTSTRQSAIVRSILTLRASITQR
jgi:hypothetical protein